MHPRGDSCFDSGGDDVVIVGVGAVCGAGVGLPALLAAARGAGGVNTQVDDAVMGVERYVPARRLRRLGRSARMMLVSAHEALDGYRPDEKVRSEIGLICGTGVGALEETTEFLGQIRTEGVCKASPSLFPNSVMSATAGYVSLELGLQGYGATVTQDALSGELAVASAADALRLRRAPMILAGGVDEVSRAMEVAYRRANRTQTGFGEGAAALLMRCGHARSEQLARLAGYATVGSERASSPIVAAAQEALELAGVAPSEVALVVAREEASHALSELLGDPFPSVVDVVPKIGLWGAIGTLNVALAAALVAEGLPNALVCGLTSAAPVSSRCEPTSLATALVLRGRSEGGS